MTATDIPPIDRLVHDGYLEMRFAREAKLNAISMDMLELLGRAVTEVQEQRDLRGLLITANGRYFSAGVDLSITPDSSMAASEQRRWIRRFHQTLDEIELCEQPVVVAIGAPCLGLGVELSVTCDFRLASSAASFRLPEVNIGLVPSSGGISRLNRIVGPAWTKWMAVAGRSIDAEQALRIGLVQALYDDREFDDQIHAFMRDLCALPAETVSLGLLATDMTADQPGRRRELDRLVASMLPPVPPTARR